MLPNSTYQPIKTEARIKRDTLYIDTFDGSGSGSSCGHEINNSAYIISANYSSFNNHNSRFDSVLSSLRLEHRILYTILLFQNRNMDLFDPIHTDESIQAYADDVVSYFEKITPEERKTLKEKMRIQFNLKFFNIALIDTKRGELANSVIGEVTFLFNSLGINHACQNIIPTAKIGWRGILPGH